MLLGEVVRRELRREISRRSKVVVDDVQYHAHSELVRAVHKAAQVVRRSVKLRRRVPTHPVVTPSELARECIDGHQLNERDSQVTQMRQLLNCGAPSSLRRERPDVKFVDDLAQQLRSRPVIVCPIEAAMIDNLRRPKNTLRLKIRARVRIIFALAIQLIKVKSTVTNVRNMRRIEPVCLADKWNFKTFASS